MSKSRKRLRAIQRELERLKKVEEHKKKSEDLHAPSRHHRHPKCLGGGEGANISIIPTSHHRAWHTLFQAMTPDRIADEINDKYLDTEYEFVCIKRT